MNWVSVYMTPAPPRPSVRVPRLPFACIRPGLFAVAIAMVRVLQGQEQQGSRSGDASDPPWRWESPGLPCSLQTLWTGVTGPAHKKIPGSDSEHPVMEWLKILRRSGLKIIEWGGFQTVPLRVAVTWTREQGTWEFSPPASPEHLHFCLSQTGVPPEDLLRKNEREGVMLPKGKTTNRLKSSSSTS